MQMGPGRRPCRQCNGRLKRTNELTSREQDFGPRGDIPEDCLLRRAKVRLRASAPPMMKGRANTESRIIMRIFAALLVLVGHCFVSHTAAAAQSQDCKLCRDDYTACVKAHTRGACKTNYDICMNHCRKK